MFPEFAYPDENLNVFGCLLRAVGNTFQLNLFLEQLTTSSPYT